MPCVSANPCSAWGTKARRLPIAVGDKVRVRDDKTSDYWSAVVKSIEVDGMIVQWESDDGPGAYVNVPLGSVRGKGADGDYGDGCSVLWRFLALSDTHTCVNTSCCNVYSCIICSLSGLVSVISIQFCSLQNYRSKLPKLPKPLEYPLDIPRYVMNPHDIPRNIHDNGETPGDRLMGQLV